MNEKERLLHALFDKNNDREHLNIRLFRDSSDDISPEDICREANSALLQIELGLAPSQPEFADAASPIVDLEKVYGD